MKLYKLLVLPLLGLILSVLVFFPLYSMEGAFYGYSPPLKVPDYPHQVGDKNSNVLLIIVDGLRVDLAQSLTSLSKFEGASGTLRTKPPSWSDPCLSNILTGTWQEIHSVTSNEFKGSIPVEQIFTFSSSAFTTAFSVDEGGRALIGNLANMAYAPVSPRSPEEEDALILNKAKEFLALKPSFLLVHFGELDHYLHQWGVSGEPTKKALQNIDSLLNDLLSVVDLNSYSVIVTSDHGHLNQGGHGGGEDVVLTTPLFMFGAKIKAGVQVSGNQVDIAPTVAALTGSPIPRYALGEPLWEALDLTFKEKAGMALRLLEERDKFAQAYFKMLNAQYLPVDTSSLKSSPDDVALYTTAEDLRKTIDSEIQSLRTEKINQERNSRLYVPIVCGLFLLGFLTLGFKKRWPLALLNALVVLILFLLIYSEVLGLSFSFSILKVGSFLEFFLIWGLPLLLSETIVFLLLPLQLRDVKAEELTKFGQKTLFALSLLLIFLFSLVFCVNGMSSSWHLPDFGLGFQELALLLLVIWNGLFSLFVPLVFWLFWKRVRG
jgi:hypothetical protein